MESRVDISPMLARIASAPVIQHPFPHLYIEGLLPDALYSSLMAELPAREGFDKVFYPGVGRGWKRFRKGPVREKVADHGLALSSFPLNSVVGEVTRFFGGTAFQRSILEKLSAPDTWDGHGPAIPAEKHHFFVNGANNVTTVYDLHKDLPGFEISPHRDVDEKLLTFLYYMEPDEALADWGTLLCAPRAGISYDDVENAPGTPGHPYCREWDLFDVVKVARAAPNSLLVFAPNYHSYHAVKLDIPKNHPRRERTVLRGFIRSGSNQENFIKPYQDKATPPTLLGRARSAVSRLMR